MLWRDFYPLCTKCVAHNQKHILLLCNIYCWLSISLSRFIATPQKSVYDRETEALWDIIKLRMIHIFSEFYKMTMRKCLNKLCTSELCMFLFQTNSLWFGLHCKQSWWPAGSAGQHAGHVPLVHPHRSVQQPFTGQWSSQLPAPWNQEKRASWFNRWGRGQQVSKLQADSISLKPWFCTVDAPVSVQ